MKTVYCILAFFVLASACACAQMTIISGSTKDPEVRPDQLTATIVHYQDMRTSARRTIRILAMALENTKGSKASLSEAINDEQDIVESANWCILALRDKVAGAEACMLTRAETIDQGQKGVCQLAGNPVVHSHCSERTASVKSIRND